MVVNEALLTCFLMHLHIECAYVFVCVRACVCLYFAGFGFSLIFLLSIVNVQCFNKRCVTNSALDLLQHYWTVVFYELSHV